MGGGHLAGDDVEVRLEAHTAHADGVLDALFVVDRELLGDDVEDFFSRLHHELVHVLDEGFNVVLADLRFKVFPGDESAVLQALDVLAGDADVDEADLGADLLLSLLNRLLDGRHGAVDVGDHATRDTHRLAAAVAEQLDFAKLVFLPNEAGNLRGSDVEADNDFLGVLWG